MRADAALDPDDAGQQRHAPGPARSLRRRACRRRLYHHLEHVGGRRPSAARDRGPALRLRLLCDRAVRDQPEAEHPGERAPRAHRHDQRHARGDQRPARRLGGVERRKRLGRRRQRERDDHRHARAGERAAQHERDQLRPLPERQRHAARERGAQRHRERPRQQRQRRFADDHRHGDDHDPLDQRRPFGRRCDAYLPGGWKLHPCSGGLRLQRSRRQRLRRRQVHVSDQRHALLRFGRRGRRGAGRAFQPALEYGLLDRRHRRRETDLHPRPTSTGLAPPASASSSATTGQLARQTRTRTRLRTS